MSAQVLSGKTHRFSSRTLGRVRASSPSFLTSLSLFQFTHPGKGATATGGTRNTQITMFQFTHPGKGATGMVFIFVILIYQFQFTHPGKGATLVCPYFR